jgi:hypothetical protein
MSATTIRCHKIYLLELSHKTPVAWDSQFFSLILLSVAPHIESLSDKQAYFHYAEGGDPHHEPRFAKGIAGNGSFEIGYREGQQRRELHSTV